MRVGFRPTPLLNLKDSWIWIILVLSVSRKPNLTKKIIRNIPGYTLENKPFKNNNQNYYGGLATYFRHGVNFKNLKVKDTRDQNGEIKIETQAFEIYSSDSPYILVNIYSRGCDLKSLNNLSSLISAFSELKELVITGDFNSHHPWWGAQRSDSHGKAVFEWVEQIDLVLLNDGSPTRLDPARGIFTCLDLTFTSPKIANKAFWQVIDDNWNSDHFPNLISILKTTLNSTENSNFEEKFIYEKADWELFRKLCEDITLTDVFSENIYEFSKKVTSTFLSMAKQAIPVKNKTLSQNKRAMMALYRSTGWYVKSIHTKHYITWELV